MVAADPAEGLAELWRVEHAHFAAGRAQRCPERAARLAQAADPVDHHRHEHPGLRPLDQRIAERAADLVVANDVVLQQHALAGAADRRQPCLVIGGGIDQQFHGIATDQRRTGGAAEGLLSQQAARGRGDQERGHVWSVGDALVQTPSPAASGMIAAMPIKHCFTDTDACANHLPTRSARPAHCRAAGTGQTAWPAQCAVSADRGHALALDALVHRAVADPAAAKAGAGTALPGSRSWSAISAPTRSIRNTRWIRRAMRCRPMSRCTSSTCSPARCCIRAVPSAATSARTTPMSPVTWRCRTSTCWCNWWRDARGPMACATACPAIRT